ncbi:hypothetical protein [Rhizobium sp. 2MFCol3.1]|nr:hypothetical protein [Rhizobium sp. 2MFCol3.1]
MAAAAKEIATLVDGAPDPTMAIVPHVPGLRPSPIAFALTKAFA